MLLFTICLLFIESSFIYSSPKFHSASTHHDSAVHAPSQVSGGGGVPADSALDALGDDVDGKLAQLLGPLPYTQRFPPHRSTPQS